MIWQRLRAIFLTNWEEAPTRAQSDDEIGDALRRMEQAILQARKETARVMADARTSPLQPQEQVRAVRGGHAQAALADREGDDASARVALRNGEECETISPVLRQQVGLPQHPRQDTRRRPEQLQARQQ